MNKDLSKAYLAFAAICVLWGTTYLALRIGVDGFPPFLFSALRQFSAGVILLVILLAMGKMGRPDRKEIFRLSVSGILLIGLGNGIIGWAEKYIPSGLAALIVSIMPVYVVLINLIISKQKQPVNWYLITGIIIGAIGVGLIFRDNVADLGNPAYLGGILISFFAAFCWAVGSVFMKVKPVTTDSFTNTTVQFLAGGSFLFILSFIFDDLSNVQPITNESLMALIYLIIFGSLIAFLCFVYAVKHLPVGLVSIYAYINPLFAIILGYVILHEKLTWMTVIAFVTTITGVYFVNKGYKSKASGATEQKSLQK